MKLTDKLKSKIDKYFLGKKPDEIIEISKKYNLYNIDDYQIQYSTHRISPFIMINGYIMNVSFWLDEMNDEEIMLQKKIKAIEIYEHNLEKRTLKSGIDTHIK